MKSLSVSEKYGWSRYIAHQAYYSLVNREYEWELMPLGIDQGIGALVWSPLAGGRLGGKYGRLKPAPKDGRVAAGGSPVPQAVIPDEVFYSITDVLEDIAAETGKSMAQISLNWLLQRPTVSSLVIGARNEEQLQQNLDAVGWQLSPEHIGRLDAASDVPMTYPYWHQQQIPSLNPSPIRR